MEYIIWTIFFEVLNIKWFFLLFFFFPLEVGWVMTSYERHTMMQDKLLLDIDLMVLSIMASH